jgi:hypothetical protein
MGTIWDFLAGLAMGMVWLYHPVRAPFDIPDTAIEQLS